MLTTEDLASFEIDNVLFDDAHPFARDKPEQHRIVASPWSRRLCLHRQSSYIGYQIRKADKKRQARDRVAARWMEWRS